MDGRGIVVFPDKKIKREEKGRGKGKLTGKGIIKEEPEESGTLWAGKR